MLRKTTLSRALSLAFGATALTLGISSTVLAQSNASGNIFGKVQPNAGTTVVVKNVETNLTRTLTVDANGNFIATQLPIGRYSAQLMKGTQVVGTTEVEIIVGQGVEAFFAEAAGGTKTVEVTARRKTIDVSSSNNGTSFNAKQLANLPMQQNVDAIIQLAPNTTRADTRYPGGASFAGGGPSENAFYINGFPVTNPLTQLGASELPFGAIAQAQILTGGFGAEFGRSVGGVVNITTKSGTNNWEAGVKTTVQPRGLRSKYSNLYYANTGAFPSPVTTPSGTGTDGTLRRYRADDSRQDVTYGAYVGGPIIQDKLFMFLSAESRKTNTSQTNPSNTSTSTNNATAGWQDQDTKVDRYMAKFDWNITDDHRLEATFLGDNTIIDQAISGFNYANLKRVGAVTSTTHFKNYDGVNTLNGGNTGIFKYTGNLTDNLTLSALWGKSTIKHENAFGGSDPTKFLVVADTSNRAPGLTYNNPQPFSGNVLAPGAKDEIESSRLDLEYKLGSHTLRAGVDSNKLSSLNAGVLSSGGGTYTYLRTSTPNGTTNVTGGSFGALPASAIRAVDPTDGKLYGYYVTKTLFSTVTDAYSNQEAQYLEDKWQLTKDLVATIGVRSESFDNQNGDHEKYIEQKNQIAPRFGLAWDVNGDASLKVFGSAGRYHLQIPTHLAVRGASRSTFTDQYFAYTGVNADGVPTGLTQLTAPLSGNNEYGQRKDVESISSKTLKPTYQDELTLGFEKAFSPTLNFGAKATYRTLKSTIDDFCDQRPIEKWADRNHVDISKWGGFNCSNFNPGEDATFLLDFTGGTGKYTEVKLTAAELGFEKVKRTYSALDLFVEHPYRDGWYGRVNYTWSRSKGNTEGQTKSDNGQIDVAATSTWDYPELMVGADGLLPNDRTHQIKAFGYIDLTPEWTIGGNVLLASGRPRSCIGTAANPGDSPNYNSAAWYCGGANSAQNVLTPRGTIGNLPWDKRLDINVNYKPSFLKGLSLKMDIFNVFDAQTVQTVEERFNNRTARRNTYESVLSTTAPRSVMFSAEYNHKF